MLSNIECIEWKSLDISFILNSSSILSSLLPTFKLYTWFHFLLFICCPFTIFIHPLQSQVPWAPLQDCLYSRLLDSYLFHFLPPSGLIPNPSSMGIGISPRGFTKYHQSPSSPSSPGRPLQQQGSKWLDGNHCI